MNYFWNFQKQNNLMPFSFKKENDLNKLVKDEANIKNYVQDLRQKVEEARSSLAINKSRGRVLEVLLQQMKSGKIPGIYGRLVSSCFSGHFCIVLFPIASERLSDWVMSPLCG